MVPLEIFNNIWSGRRRDNLPLEPVSRISPRLTGCAIVATRFSFAESIKASGLMETILAVGSPAEQMDEKRNTLRKRTMDVCFIWMS